MFIYEDILVFLVIGIWFIAGLIFGSKTDAGTKFRIGSMLVIGFAMGVLISSYLKERPGYVAYYQKVEEVRRLSAEAIRELNEIQIKIDNMDAKVADDWFGKATEIPIR